MKAATLLNPVLSGYASRYYQAQPSVGRRLMPLLNTQDRAATYYVLDSSNWLNVPTDISHAPGAHFKRSQTTLSDDKYYAEDYGIEELIPNEEAAQYGTIFSAQKIASARATNTVLINHELRVKALATSGAVPTSSPVIKWNAANSTPRADIEAAAESIFSATGISPNRIVLPRAVRNVLRRHPEVVSLFQYTRGGIVSDAMLAEALGFDEIIVAGSQINNANEAQAASVAQIWGTSVVLAVVTDSQDLKAVNFGRTMNWTGAPGTSANGVGIFQYDEEDRDSVVVRARQYTDEKLTGPSAGYHLSSVLA